MISSGGHRCLRTGDRLTITINRGDAMADDEDIRTPLPARLPRYVRNLNAWAESFGLGVEMGVYPYDNDPEERLWAKWSGSRGQLLDLVAPVPSYRLPLRRGHLVVPRGAQSARPHCLLGGDVTVDGDQVALEIDFGPPVYTLANHNGIETITYAEEILHHGSREALLAMGVHRDCLPTPNRRRREYDGVEFEREASGELTGRFTHCAGWYSVAQPDGQVLYCVDTSLKTRRLQADEDERARTRAHWYPRPATQPAPVPVATPVQQARPSHLRLVVDNTRPEDRP
jgi:hypothetical protein